MGDSLQLFAQQNEQERAKHSQEIGVSCLIRPGVAFSTDCLLTQIIVKILTICPFNYQIYTQPALKELEVSCSHFRKGILLRTDGSSSSAAI